MYCTQLFSNGTKQYPAGPYSAVESVRLITVAARAAADKLATEITRILREPAMSKRLVEMGVDPGLQKDGVEAHLQKLLELFRPDLHPCEYLCGHRGRISQSGVMR